jgi:sec-independent protein translocase protein TatA
MKVKEYERRAMGDIGVPELLILLAIVVVLFGPARLAGIGKSLGEAIRSFRNEVRDETQQTTEQGEKHS